MRCNLQECRFQVEPEAYNSLNMWELPNSNISTANAPFGSYPDDAVRSIVVDLVGGHERSTTIRLSQFGVDVELIPKGHSVLSSYRA